MARCACYSNYIAMVESTHKWKLHILQILTFRVTLLLETRPPSPQDVNSCLLTRGNLFMDVVQVYVYDVVHTVHIFLFLLFTVTP